MPLYKARISRAEDSTWLATAVALPHCWSRGGTRDEAVEKLRREIRHRIELCPCSSVDAEYVRVEIEVEEKQAPESAGGIPSAGGGSAQPHAGWRRWDD